MATVNAKRALLFTTNKDDKFYFTADDQGYRKESSAINHATIIKRERKMSDAVEVVTRRDVEEWKAAQKEDGAPAPVKGSEEVKGPTNTKELPVIADGDRDDVKQAKQGVIDAAQVLAEAKAAQQKLPKNTGAAKKSAAADRVTDCESDLAEAETVLEQLLSA